MRKLKNLKEEFFSRKYLKNKYNYSDEVKNSRKDYVMRTYQHFGLTGTAELWLEKFCVQEPEVVCPICDHVLITKLKILSEEQLDSFYENGPVLHTYLTKNGGIVKEVVQMMPWSSGPCGFLCLELEDGTRIGEWDEEEIEHII